MCSALKRALSEDERPISPPSTRRKLIQDEPSASKELAASSTSHLRIFSWNVNGVGPFLQRPISFSRTATSQPPFRAFLARHNWPHLLCLQEIKINRKDTATIRAFQRATNLDSAYSPEPERPSTSNPTYTTHLSLPRDKHNATGFGGKVHGVATLIRDDLSTTLNLPLTTTTRTVDWDLEGRVLITTLSIPPPSPTSPHPHRSPTKPSLSSPPLNPPSTHLTILHAYWPNGTTHPYHSPTTGLPHGTRHDHKLRFHAHLLREALSLQSQPHRHVILIGDMNIAPARIDGYPNLRTSPVQHVFNRAGL